MSRKRKKTYQHPAVPVSSSNPHQRDRGIDVTPPLHQSGGYGSHAYYAQQQRIQADPRQYSPYTNHPAHPTRQAATASRAAQTAYSRNSARYEKEKSFSKQKTGRVVKTAVSSLIAVIVLAAVFVGSSLYKMNANMTTSSHANDLLTAGLDTPAAPAEPAEPKAANTLPSDFYVLLLGVDSDDNRREGDEAQFFDGVFRSDSIMLAHVNTDTKDVSLCSFERDIKTIIDGYEDDGYYKLNAAYALGGAELMKSEIEELTGVDISHVAVVDMGGLTNIIDAAGGVDVEVEEAFFDEELNDGLPEAGVQHLNGYQAVMYCRSRMPFLEGDVARARHQRMVLTALAKKLMSGDVFALYNAATMISENVGTDFSLDQIFEVGSKLAGMDADQKIHSMMTPVENYLDEDVWYSFLIRNDWKRIVLMLKENNGILPTDEEMAAARGLVLNTDTVYADESGYSYNEGESYTQADREAEQAAALAAETGPKDETAGELNR